MRQHLYLRAARLHPGTTLKNGWGEDGDFAYFAGGVPSSFATTASIWTKASMGKAETPTVLRAGTLPGKNVVYAWSTAAISEMFLMAMLILTTSVLKQGAERGHRIPQGGLYRLVSCPNYLGELVEWLGWALAAWSLPALAFALYTASNPVPRAASNHRWYRQTFPDYPPQRKAIVPYVY